MRREIRILLLAALGTGINAACTSSTYVAKPVAIVPAPPALVSGIELKYVDDGVRPQDDLYRHINGKWLAVTEIPPDRGRVNTFDQLDDESQVQRRIIIEGLLQSVDPGDPDQQKIADLYASFMDESSVEALGLEPLASVFAKIDEIKNKSDIASAIAHLTQIGVSAPYTPVIHLDAKDSSRYVFDLRQSGLGMPDRDYYLLDEEKIKEVRTQYLPHVKKMLALSGDVFAAKHAREIVALETELARSQWTRVENRDPVKTYNKFEFEKLAKLAPGYDWGAYLKGAGVTGKTTYLVIRQPSYIAKLNQLIAQRPLAVWKAYFRWHILSDFAPYLGKDFVDEDFAFYGTVLRGIPENRPRWKRGVDLVEDSIGEALGRLYVTKNFPPESKTRMDQLVKNLLAAYKADIDGLDWMGPTTRQKAQDKLAKITTKIGYPKTWRNYETLRITKGDLVGDVIRAQKFEYERNLNKLGHAVDREEWGMTPQTVNAYYDPEKNEIVFPAAILQPPFFNSKADDAVNYGSIGAIIGHEISHGFDDQGSQYDGNGNLLDPPGWFTQDDLDRFKRKTQALVMQYGAYEPVRGHHVDGELTLGENIADNSGLAIAYKAYQLSLGGKEPPVIDALTGAQRFYSGWAQAWREKIRTNQLIVQLESDPHSPNELRGRVPEMNQASFYSAFDVKETDKMYLAPDKRVTLW